MHTGRTRTGKRFAQVVVAPEKIATANALKPIFAETRFGQTVMVFDGANSDALIELGTVSTPTLSDLFVALMSRDGGANS